MTISFESTGSFKKTEQFLNAILKNRLYSQLDAAAREGVNALSNATPAETGLTANSWSYEIHISSTGCKITWFNTHVVNGSNIAILLQYGHGTGTGGYVNGRDYINPAMKPVFDKIADRVWKAVTSA